VSSIISTPAVAGTIVNIKKKVLKLYWRVMFSICPPTTAANLCPMATAKYHTPSDRVIDGTGIQPDVVLELPKGTTPSSDMSDIQIQKAIELLK